MSSGVDGETCDLITCLSRRMRTALAVPSVMLGPELVTVRCPACGMARAYCRAFLGEDPVHDRDIRGALARDSPPPPALGVDQ